VKQHWERTSGVAAASYFPVISLVCGPRQVSIGSLSLSAVAGKGRAGDAHVFLLATLTWVSGNITAKKRGGDLERTVKIVLLRNENRFVSSGRTAVSELETESFLPFESRSGC
jgi:hypothetical protein